MIIDIMIIFISRKHINQDIPRNIFFGNLKWYESHIIDKRLVLIPRYAGNVVSLFHMKGYVWKWQQRTHFVLVIKTRMIWRGIIV